MNVIQRSIKISRREKERIRNEETMDKDKTLDNR